MMKVKISPNIKAIAWDFDGTIINSYQIVREIVDEIADERGLPIPSQEILLKNYHGTMRDSLHAYFGKVFSDEELDQVLESFLSKQTRFYHFASEHLIEDALTLLGKANKASLKQVLVTNREHKKRGNASPRALVANSVLKDHIHEVISGDDGEFRKPDARVLEQFLHDNMIAPHEILVIGDQFVDGKLAMNLGTKAILVNRDNDEIVHLDQLGEGWEEHITVVKSLHDVEL